MKFRLALVAVLVFVSIILGISQRVTISPIVPGGGGFSTTNSRITGYYLTTDGTNDYWAIVSATSTNPLPSYVVTNQQTTAINLPSTVNVSALNGTNLALPSRSNMLMVVNSSGGVTNAQRIFYVETNQAQILSNIVFAASSGDEVRLGAGVFQVGLQVIRVPVGVTLSGQGRDLTRIIGDIGLATNGPIVSMASTSTVKNLTIEGGKRTSYTQSLLGNAVGFAAALPTTNFLVSNVRLIGESDCFYLTQPNSSGIIENCDFESKYDTMVLLDGTIDGTPSISLLIKDSRIVGDWLGATEPVTVVAKTVRTIYASGVQLRLHNNYIVATNANNSSALFLTVTDPTNWVRVVGGTLIAAGTNSGSAINFDSSPEITDIKLTGVGTETTSLHSGHLIAVSSNSIFGGPDNTISNSVESGIFGDHSVVRGSSNSFVIGAYITNTSPGSVMFGFHTRAATMSSNGVITVPGGITTSNGSFVGILTIQAGGALVNEAIGTSPRAAFFNADGILTNVTSASPTTEYVKADGSVGTPAGAGDVTAASTFGTDNRVIRSDGTGKGVQASGVTLSDADAFSGITSLTSTVLQASSVVAASYTNTSLPTNAIVRIGPGGILTTSIIGANLSLGADGTLSATGGAASTNNAVQAMNYAEIGSGRVTNDFLIGGYTQVEVVSNRVLNLPDAGSGQLTIWGSNQVWRVEITSNITINLPTAAPVLRSNVVYRLYATNNASTVTWDSALRWKDGKTLSSAPSLQTGEYIIEIVKNHEGTNAWVLVSPQLELAVGTAHMVSVTNSGTVTHQVTNFTGTGAIVLSNAPTITSPVFLSNPTAPTPSPGDADTTVATTAFVDTAQKNSNATFYARQNGSAILSNITASGHSQPYIAINTNSGTLVNATNLQFKTPFLIVSNDGGGAIMSVHAKGRYRNIYVDAAAMVSNTTAGATFETVENATTGNLTNRTMVDSYVFSGSASNLVQFKLAMPLDWDLGTVKVKLWTWSTNNIATTTNVWAVSATAVKSTSVITNMAWGTELEITNVVSSAGGQALLTPATPALTVGNTPAAAGQLVWFYIMRKPLDADDNDGGQCRLLGAWIQYHESASEVAAW